MRTGRLIALLASVLLLMLPSLCRADHSRFLDAALSMLEEGNPFLVRYNEDTGAEIEARFPLGCPYFWGGRRAARILETASPDQDSDYYRKDLTYLYGFDCVGFTRWVMKECGLAEHDAISSLLDRSLYKDDVIYRAAKHTGKERVRYLRVGDLGAIRHPSGGYHIVMFIGTLVDFNYTRKNLPPELVPYLNYPLVIHCAGSSDYYERYRLWLDQKGMKDVQPPYGGVIVSLLDASAGDAPSFTPDILDLKKPCFDLEGYHLEILDLSGEKQERWIHWRHTP